MDFFRILSSFSQVETVISLLAFIVAGFFGYLAYQGATKMKQIGHIIEKADSQTKADLAVSLAGVFPSYRIPELTKQHGFEIVKLQLQQRATEFKSRINLLRLGIVFMFILIITLVVKNYINLSETHGNQSPIIKGDNARVTFNTIDSLKKDSTK